MGFKYGPYTLFKRDVTLKNGAKTTIYFFSKKPKPKSGEPCDMPTGMEVIVNQRTGLPYLKKK